MPREADDARAPQVRALRRLPPGRAQGPLPRRGLRGLPHGGRLQAREVRPRGAHEVPARRQARGDRVRRPATSPPRRRPAVPPREADRRLPGREERVRLLPRRRPQGEARPGLRDLPRDGVLQALGVPAPAPARVLPGRARRRPLREVPPPRAGTRGRPRERPRRSRRLAAVQGRLLPVRGLPQGPAPRTGRPGLREVPRPRGEGLQGGPLRPHPVEVPRSRASTRPRPARNATRRRPATFPAGSGTAVRLTGLSIECRACHKDPHLGQLSPRCETCHDAETFKIAKYTHPAKKETEGFFVGKHAAIAVRRLPQEGDGQTTPQAAGRPSATPSRPTARTATRTSTTARSDATARRATTRSSGGRPRAPSTRPPRSRSRASTSRFRAPRATSRASSRARRRAATTATGSASRTTASRRSSGPTAQTCHRPIAWTAVTWSHAGRDRVHPRDAPQDPRLRVLPQEPGLPGDADATATRATAPTTSASRTRTTSRAASRPTARAATSPPSPTWQGATFTHSTFPLAGVHATQACAACHKNNVFKGTPRDCFSCHRTDYQNSKNPPHAAAGVPDGLRHLPQVLGPELAGRRLQPQRRRRRSPLGGVHVTQPCTACHVNNVYKGTPRDCFSCHQTDYQNSKNPVARRRRLRDDLRLLPQVHGSPTWKPATPSTTTRYDVRARGRARDAGLRHATTRHATSTTSTRARPRRPASPATRPTSRTPKVPVTTSRPASRRPATPATSSPTPTWKPATFNHTRRFPLVGVHATTPCADVPQRTPRREQLHDRPDDLLRLPPEGLHRRHDPVPHTGFATTCDTCHKNTDTDLEPEVRLQPHRRTSRSPAPTSRRPAPSATTRRTLRAQQLPHRAHEPVLGVPPERLQHRQDARRPHRVELPDHLRLAATSSPTRRGCSATFTHTTFPLVGVHATTACADVPQPAVRPVRQQLHDRPDDLLRLPREGLQRRHDARCPTPASRRRATAATRTPTRPGARSPPSTTPRTSRSRAPTSRRPAPSATTRRTPRAQQLPHRAHEPVLGLPPERLQHRQDRRWTTSRRASRRPATLPQVLRRDLDARDVQPTRRSRSSASTPRRPARRATTRRTPRPRTTTRPSRRPATAAT